MGPSSTRPATTPPAWVTLDELPGNFATAVSQDGRQKENPFDLQYGEGAFAFSLHGAERLRAPMTPELGTWHHLVGDATSGEVSLYVDGTVSVVGGLSRLGVGRLRDGGALLCQHRPVGDRPR